MIRARRIVMIAGTVAMSVQLNACAESVMAPSVDRVSGGAAEARDPNSGPRKNRSCQVKGLGNSPNDRNQCDSPVVTFAVAPLPITAQPADDGSITITVPSDLTVPSPRTNDIVIGTLSAGEDVTWTFTGVDFVIAPDGTLTFVGATPACGSTLYSVTITAKDAVGNPSYLTLNVTVHGPSCPSS